MSGNQWLEMWLHELNRALHVKYIPEFEEYITPPKRNIGH